MQWIWAEPPGCTALKTDTVLLWKSLHESGRFRFIISKQDAVLAPPPAGSASAQESGNRLLNSKTTGSVILIMLLIINAVVVLMQSQLLYRKYPWWFRVLLTLSMTEWKTGTASNWQDPPHYEMNIKMFMWHKQKQGREGKLLSEQNHAIFIILFSISYQQESISALWMWEASESFWLRYFFTGSCRLGPWCV